MKKATFIAYCALPLVFAQAQANPLTVEPAATAYWEIPLGTSRSGQVRPSFGLRLDQAVRDNSGALVQSSFSMHRVPVVDFRFNASGMQGVYVRGINMSPPPTMKMGLEGTAIWVLGGVALGITALIVEDIRDDDKQQCVTFAARNLGPCDQ